MRTRSVLSGLLALAASACASAGVGQEDRAPDAPVRSRVFDRTPEVQVWLSGDRVFRQGDRVRAYVRAEDGAYVMVFRVDTEGRITVLYPADPRDDAFMRQGETRLASRRGRESFYVDDEYTGLGYVFAIASNEPFRTGHISSQGGWEYSHIGDRTRSEPFTAMHDFARQMLSDPQSDYALDYVHYSVERRLRYASYYDHHDVYHDHFHHSHWHDPVWHVYWPYFVIGVGFRSCGNYYDPYFHPCYGYYGGHGYYGYYGRRANRAVYVNESRIRSRFDFKTASAQPVAIQPGNVIDRRRRITDGDPRRPGSNNITGVGGVGTGGGAVIGTGRRVREVADGPGSGGGEQGLVSEELRRVGNERDRVDVTRRYPGTDTPRRDEPRDTDDKPRREPLGGQTRLPADEQPRRAPMDFPRPEPRSEPRNEPRSEPRNEPRSEPRNEPRSEPRREPPRQEPRRDPGAGSDRRAEPRSDSRSAQPSAAPSRGVGRRTPGAS
ncbi:MAG: DUF4384 domain-containing protein [Gemmatimonadaceae bacterium]